MHMLLYIPQCLITSLIKVNSFKWAYPDYEKIHNELQNNYDTKIC